MISIDKWQQCFSKILQEDRKKYKQQDNQQQNREGQVDLITREVVHQAIRKMKNPQGGEVFQLSF